MPRARNIKPGFFTNDELAELPALTRLLFIGLWCIADREGRLEDKPKRIKVETLPYDDFDVDAALSDLMRAGFLTRYSVDGARYIQIDKFAKHQNPHVKEAESTIPAPDKSGASTGQESKPEQPKPERATLIPDSGLLIPDSIDMSGKPDDAPPAPDKKSTLTRQAEEVLTFLNEKTGRAYRPVEANLNLIRARLKEGATVEDCRMVVARKWRDWKEDDKMREYARPATLFAATNFAQYIGECVS